jgi:hypothetical protein
MFGLTAFAGPRLSVLRGLPPVRRSFSAGHCRPEKCVGGDLITSSHLGLLGGMVSLSRRPVPPSRRPVPPLARLVPPFARLVPLLARLVPSIRRLVSLLAGLVSLLAGLVKRFVTRRPAHCAFAFVRTVAKALCCRGVIVMC